MDPAGRLLLVRHARTARSGTRRRIGRLDVPLDDTGREQAALLTRALDDVVPAGPLSVYSSPLQRARQTIEGFATLRSVPVLLDPDLMEMDYGDAEEGGRPRVSRDHLYDPIPGGESLAQVWDRCERFLRRVRAEPAPGGTALVVAHYRVNKLLAGAAAGMDLETAVRLVTIKPANGSVVEVPLPGDGVPPVEPRIIWSPPGGARPPDPPG